MFYRDISLPAIVEIGDNIASEIDNLLHTNHIYFEKKILFTQKTLFELYGDTINKNIFTEIVLIQGGNFEETKKELVKSDIKDALFIAFGGGSIIDFVKIYAKNYKLPFVTIPSTLSNDAIYSPIARLFHNGLKKSFGATSPIGIIIDTSIIKHSPSELILAGVGDLVSNLSAIQDCKLAIQDKKENIDNFSMMLSKLSVDGILPFTKKDLKSNEFIEKLAMGLITSGLSMVLARTSRPASGAEHLISHAIDLHYPELSVPHGIQVAWAQLLLEKEYRHSNYNTLNNYYRQIGLTELISSNPDLNSSFFYKLLPLAKNIRSRYTILDKVVK